MTNISLLLVRSNRKASFESDKNDKSKNTLGCVLDFVQNTLNLENIMNTSMNPQKLLLILSLIVILLWSTKLHIFRANQNLQVVKPGRLLIDGQEYNYVPSFGTLYNSYETAMSSGKKKNTYLAKGRNSITGGESDIWDWINNRGSVISPQAHVTRENVEGHKLQQLAESVKVTELQLNHMKTLLDKIEEDTSNLSS